MNFSKVNLNLLRALDTLLDERHVGRAADKYCITQPAMSHSLQQLREIFGDPLLVRTGNSMRLTSFAVSIQKDLKKNLLDIQVLFNRSEQFDPNEHSYDFRIGASNYAELVLIPALMRAIDQYGYQIKVNSVWLQGSQQKFDALLESNQLDIAITEDVLLSDQLASEKLQKHEFVCVTCREHPIVSKRKTLHAYLAYPHVLVNENLKHENSIKEAINDLGKTRCDELSINHYFALTRILPKTKLIATVPKHLSEFFIQQYPLVAWNYPLSTPENYIVQIWHKSNSLHPAHNWLREFFKDTANKFKGYASPIKKSLK